MRKVLVVALIVGAVSYMCSYCTVVGYMDKNIYASEIPEEIVKGEPEPIKLEFDPEMNYGELMICAASIGDIEQGREYERLRELKKKHFGIKDNFTFDNLYLLAKIVEAEAGSTWITDEHKQLVASVVLNRVNSPRFPNTIEEVVYAPGQYSLAGTERFETLVPTYESVRNAAFVLLNGSVAPETVVFQANFPQGTGVYKTFTPEKLGTTYFCHMEE